MTRPKVVVVGSINMDMVAALEKMPQKGETVLGKDLQLFPGGKGANQAVAAARLGADVSMVGCVGNDGHGEKLLKHLNEESIHTKSIETIDDVPTGVAIIHLHEDGDNSIVVIPGANHRLTQERVRAAEAVIKKADICLVQLEIPMDAVKEASDIAAAHDVTLILNPAPAQPLDKGLLQKVDILTPNETEASIIASDLLGEDVEMNQEVAGKLVEKVPNCQFVLTQGASGVFYKSVNGEGTVPANKVSVVDTTAAGDCFNGALAVALGEGTALEQAIEFANQAAAISVTRLGAQPSLPYRHELEKGSV